MNYPWEWCPSRTAWLTSLRPAVEQWCPLPALCLDVPRIREFLSGAIDRNEDWLYHPCAVALLDRSGARGRKDVQLSLWAAAHADRSLGFLTLTKPLQCWAPVGSKTILPGVHDLAAVCYAPTPHRLSLDPYSLSLGKADEASWGALASISEAQTEIIRGQVRSFLSAVLALESLHPACAQWIYSGVRIAIPLTNHGADRVRSWSSRTHPGAVHLDIDSGGLRVLEALVHESAHCHLYMQEASGPLIEAGDTGLYASPLRSDPRPLRGILLAYHALAYICAFYSDAIIRELGEGSFAMHELTRSREKLLQAERIIGESESRLTPSGKIFVGNTQMVAQYGRVRSLSAA